MPRSRMDAHQVSAALAGMSYPAHRWQLLTQADYYGADFDTRLKLTRLPDELYPDLATVIATVAAGLLAQHPTSVRPTP